MICVGMVTGAHGVHGLVRVKSFTAEASDLTAYGPLWDEHGASSLRLWATGEVRGQLLMRVEGVQDRTAAERLRGRRLYIPRSALPEPRSDEYYHADLVGLRAELVGEPGREAVALGCVSAVHDFGGGPMLEIAADNGGMIMVPFTHDAVPVVDVPNGRLEIAPLPGLLNDASHEAPGSAAASGATDEEANAKGVHE